ncbi:uncharacterized protein LOC144105191 [Amblyomma americanum]
MDAPLEDTTTYAQLARDPTLKIETDLQKLLADVLKFVLPDKGYLYNRLLCHNGSAPAIHGVPKVHKKEAPLRPIVDLTRSPLNKLTAYLHRVPAPLEGNTPTHVKASANSIDKLKAAMFCDDHIVVSFDGRSMFTHLPVDFAVEGSKNALNNDLSLPERRSIKTDDLRRLLKFCLSNTYSVFNNTIYKIFGAAMGASISVVCSNLALEAIESRALLSFNPPPRFFLRYIDDCFCVIRQQDAEKFLRHLKSFQGSVEFTMEEDNGRLPFLDVLIE